MNTEVFVAVLAALVAYRVLSPLIDALNPLAFFARPKEPKGAHAIQGIPGGPKAEAGRGL
jgi:hypothetical protein